MASSPSSSAPTTEAALVDRPDSFDRLLAGMAKRAGEPVALDTEADSFHHYYEKVCLVQLELGGAVVIVDPLALDVTPAVHALAGRTLLMHGADYDLRLLYRGYRFRPSALFDTMIAAQLLGETEIGLAALLKSRLGVTLDKAHQRADWSARPLAPPLVAYAAEDVRWLPRLVAVLADELRVKGRLAWHEEECARLVALPLEADRARDPENDWRLKGSNALSSRERAYLRALWSVRETRARELDVPPFRVLTNERILHAVRLAAAGEADLARLFPGRPLPPALERAVRGALAEARALPSSAWPGPRRGEGNAPDPTLEPEIDRLKKKRDLKAKELGLDPGVLASRAMLAAVARSGPSRRAGPEALAAEAGISRWRAELLSG